MKDSIINKFKKDLENKKIAIWGLGKEGISTLQFIKNNNINCIVKVPPNASLIFNHLLCFNYFGGIAQCP